MDKETLIHTLCKKRQNTDFVCDLKVFNKLHMKQSMPEQQKNKKQPQRKCSSEATEASSFNLTTWHAGH